MIKLQEVKNWLIELEKLIFDINVSIQNISRMKDSSDKFEQQILRHGFFSHFYRQSRFTIIVQLSKIFSKSPNQKYNIHKLFNRLTNDSYDSEFLEQLEKNRINSRLFSSKKQIIDSIKIQRLEIEKHEDLISRIVNLRDTVFAHSDNTAEIKLVTDLELIQIIDLAKKMNNSFRSRLIDTSFLYDMNTDWKIDYILSSIAEYGKIRQDRKANLNSNL